MTAQRKTKLVDCNPHWIINGRYTQNTDGVPSGVRFDCPEGHEGCLHAIPFTPGLDGAPAPGWQWNGAIWQRTGDTFETLTLSPSIRRVPGYTSREEAIARGCIPANVTASMLCAFHGFIRDGQIEFCGDSQ